MDSKNQLFYLCICIVVGFAAGILYEAFVCFRLIFRCDKGKNKILGFLLDIIYPVCVAFFCVFMQFFLHFPAFRVYMWIGYAVGFTIYLKILRRTLAFLQKTCYNKLAKVLRKAKIKRKTLQKGR
jgi:hypothetical protein